MDDESPSYTLKITAQTNIDDLEPTTHLLKFKIVVHETSSLTGAITNPIGHYDVWRFNVDSYREKDGAQLFDLFDADSSEAEALYAALYDESEDIKPELGVEPFRSDILHFQWGRFPSHFKFSRWSLATVERIIDTLGSGCCLATLWPWEKPEASVDDPPESVFGYLESQEAHEKHWEKIGFKRIQGTSILYRDLSKIGFDIQKILGTTK